MHTFARMAHSNGVYTARSLPKFGFNGPVYKYSHIPKASNLTIGLARRL
jgi:hypothetical protein